MRVSGLEEWVVCSATGRLKGNEVSLRMGGRRLYWTLTFGNQEEVVFHHTVIVECESTLDCIRPSIS